VYLADGWAGLQVIDVSDPANLRRVGGNPNVIGKNVSVAGGKVFVADDEVIILHEYRSAQFKQIALQDNGAMYLQLAGPPGVPGWIQRSSDLRTWAYWLGLKFSEGPLEILDPDAASQRVGFYRLAVP
jgi:hypothetical protein